MANPASLSAATPQRFRPGSSAGDRSRSWAAVVVAGALAFPVCMLLNQAACAGVFVTNSLMPIERQGFSATRLSNGQVLVAGGNDATAAQSSAHLYNARTRVWSTTGPLTTPRTDHQAVL